MASGNFELIKSNTLQITHPNVCRGTIGSAISLEQCDYWCFVMLFVMLVVGFEVELKCKEDLVGFFEDDQIKDSFARLNIGNAKQTLLMEYMTRAVGWGDGWDGPAEYLDHDNAVYVDERANFDALIILLRR